MKGATLTVFLIGMLIGALIGGNVAVATERFRRARADFRATRRGLRTLVEMMTNRFWEATKMVSLATIIATGAVGYWYYRMKG